MVSSAGNKRKIPFRCIAEMVFFFNVDKNISEMQTIARLSCVESIGRINEKWEVPDPLLSVGLVVMIRIEIWLF